MINESSEIGNYADNSKPNNQSFFVQSASVDHMATNEDYEQKPQQNEPVVRQGSVFSLQNSSFMHGGDDAVSGAA